MTPLKQIEALKQTIKYFRSEIEPHDCGWMHTTIDGIKHRIKVLRQEEKCWKEIRSKKYEKK
tara:strand:+ start:908 stop:1093 length:186 start_codon:yes stop_codon:yes gene_type:complete